MKTQVNIKATALVPDTFNPEVRSGWLSAHQIKVDGEAARAVRERELRYKLIFEDSDGYTRSVVVGLSRRWDEAKKKLIPVLGVPQSAFLFEEGEALGDAFKRVIARAETSWSVGIWDALYQQRGHEARICETKEEYEDPNWVRYTPAESVWSSLQMVQLPNWAMRHAPSRPVGITPKDRNLYRAWYGHFSSEFRAKAFQEGWVIDPEDMKGVFRAMTEPEAGDSIEYQLDTHQLGCYLLGSGEFQIRDGYLRGAFANDDFEFSMKLRNQFTERIAEFIL